MPREFAPGAPSMRSQRSHPRLEELRAGRSSDCRFDGIKPDAVRNRLPSSIARRVPIPEALHYDPKHSVLPSALAAVAADQRRRGARIEPAHVVFDRQHERGLPWLFKLLCNPGDAYWFRSQAIRCSTISPRSRVLPAHPYALEYHRRWAIDLDSIRARLRTSARCWSCRPTIRPGRSYRRGARADVSRLPLARLWR